MENEITITPIDSDKAFQAEQRIKALKSQITGMSFEMAATLKEIRDNKYYVHLGFNTANEWLSSPDIAISPSWAYNAIAMYETYVLKLGKKPEELADIDYTKLYNVMSVVKKHPEQADEWISKAKELRRIDLASEIKTKKIADRVEQKEELQKIEPVQGVVHGNPIDEVKKLAENSVDLVLTAPDPATPAYVLQELFAECRRVVKQNGSIFMFVNYKNLVDVAGAMQMNDYRLVRDIVLTYSTADSAIGINSLLSYHELVLWTSRGDQVTYNFTEVTRDVWPMSPVKSFVPKAEPQHPMEKPLDIILDIIKMATDEQQTVLDPFAGSGTIALAAKTLNRNFIAIEEDELWYKLTLEKIHSA